VRQGANVTSPGDGGTEPGPGSQSESTGMRVGLSFAGPGRADSVIAQAVARVVPLCTVNERLKARLMFGGSAQPPGYQAALRP
jgi:hypothetical protein